MRSINLKNTIIKAVIGSVVLVGGAMVASAQNVTNEYRDWQRAQIEAQRQYQDYQRTGSQRDYREWQNAQRRAQRQQLQYQRAAARYGYNNNGYGYNTSYNAGYNNSGMYRVYRNGRYYTVNSRGAELLRQAVNNGYSQGFRQGQIARQYGRTYNFRNESLYRSGTYGYKSHVARDQYQYYYQQGFERGFEDGYYSRNRYGSSAGTTANILGSVLNTILNIAAQ